ncbi:MAG: hypothetical protein ACYDCO_12695 [Armatimonadota bacterium]
MKRMLRKRWRLFLILLLLLGGGYAAYWCSTPRTYRLAASYPLTDDEGLNITDLGVLLVRHGSLSYQDGRFQSGPHVFTLRDWQGRQRWRLEVPGRPDYAFTPDGHRLAVLNQVDDETYEVREWVDGRQAWRMTLPRTAYCSNEIRYLGEYVLVQKLVNAQSCYVAIRDGRIAAVSDGEWSYPVPTSFGGAVAYGSQTTSDGSLKLVGPATNLATKETVAQRYLVTMAVRGKTITYTARPAPKLSDGIELLDDGTLLEEDGSVYQGRTLLRRLAGKPLDDELHDNLDDERYRDSITRQSASDKLAIEIIRPRTGKSWTLRVNDTNTTLGFPIFGKTPVRAARLVGNGQYAAVISHVLPSQRMDMIIRVIARSQILLPLLARYSMRQQLRLYNHRGEVKAVLPLAEESESLVMLPVDDSTYTISDYAVSNDGRALIVLVRQGDGKERLLHYAW